ncbi:MAG: HAD family hydrolase [Clostridia bacterium]|nr:HAD family hydrolase [Clostridia bacterium]
MQFKAILFDLDGTLLPMDYDEFSKGYFHLLTKTAAPYGYEPKSFLSAMMQGVEAIVKNDGKVKNATVFWNVFAGILGEKIRELDPVFDNFYETEFHKAKAFTGENPLAKKAVYLAKEKAEKVVLATNPLFPESAVSSRLSWVGLSPEDFDLVTDYDSIGFCKPNPAYFSKIVETLNLSPNECLMIGNNTAEDIKAATAAGLACYLVTDCLIADGPLPDCEKGTFNELLTFLNSL